MVNNIEVLDRLYNGLKFKDAVYTESNNICTVNFLYNPESFTPNDENKKEILNKITEIVGDFVNYKLEFINCPLDKRAIANHTYTTIVNDFPALSKNFTYDDVKVDVLDMKVKVTLRLAPHSYDYAKNLNREELVANKLQDSFLADFTVEFEKKEDEISVSNVIESNMELMSSIKEAEEKTVYTLSNITNIVGKNDYNLAIDFTKIKSAIENVVICGELLSPQKRTYKKKVTKDGNTLEIDKVFYSFAVRNEGKVLSCSIFPRQQDENKCEVLEPNMKVCCFGSFREYNGKLNFTASSIARCEYAREEIKSQFKHVNEEYHTVFPQKYIDYEQSDLFGETDKSFDGTFVVFDLETTGLESAKDEIIEIGACKIVNGRIDETFSTFVKPTKHIPKEITDLTGINDEMVKDAPTINYVMPDLYKFCYGSTMVAHNLNFDMGFIKNMSKKLSYNFDNPTMDTLEMAHQKLPGLKNYKLGTVVEKLNVVLDNAHRAINDATATAKVFIKLM